MTTLGAAGTEIIHPYLPTSTTPQWYMLDRTPFDKGNLSTFRPLNVTNFPPPNFTLQSETRQS